MKAKYHGIESQLRDLIENQKLRQYQVAEILGLHQSTVGHYCRRFGIKTQRVGPRTGEACKGGRVTNGGYDYIFLPNHPYATNKGYILESHLVMEEKIGRYLQKGEIVHHIDKNPTNNHPDNLILFGSNGEHLKHELTGHCPEWTPEGYQKLLAKAKARRKYSGNAEDRKRQAWQAGNRKRYRKEAYARQHPQTTAHPTS